MYTAPGKRVKRTATKSFVTNSPVVELNTVGWGTKVAQLNRFVDPSTSAAKTVQIGEVFTLDTGGIHELALTGGLSGAAVGDKLWIKVSDNTVHLAGTAAAGDLPLGVVDEVDASRSPAVARVNMETLQSFIPHA